MLLNLCSQLVRNCPCHHRGQTFSNFVACNPTKVVFLSSRPQSGTPNSKAHSQENYSGPSRHLRRNALAPLKSCPAGKANEIPRVTRFPLLRGLLMGAHGKIISNSEQRITCCALSGRNLCSSSILASLGHFLCEGANIRKLNQGPAPSGGCLVRSKLAGFSCSDGNAGGRS
jgi:hypothetical protein